VGKRRGTEGATTLKDRVIRGAARAVERAAELHNEAGGKGGRGKVTFKVDLSSPDVVVMLHGVQGRALRRGSWWGGRRRGTSGSRRIACAASGTRARERECGRRVMSMDTS